ncbi:hypothetical protein ES705_48668 [subsurface metagenome]
MTVELITNTQKFYGLCTDPKPTPVKGSTFTETDTGRKYIYTSAGWIEQSQPRTYRETKSINHQCWTESVFITATEYGTDFGTTYQTLNKIYVPTTKSGTRTLAVVSSMGFTGDMNTLLEVTIDGAGDSGAATFKWRTKTHYLDTWGDYTEGVTTGADITVTNGIHINFNDSGYLVADQWTVQASGTWHIPANGYCSFLTSFMLYPLDTSGAAKTCNVKVVSDDWAIVEAITNKWEEAYWRTLILIGRCLYIPGGRQWILKYFFGSISYNIHFSAIRLKK